MGTDLTIRWQHRQSLLSTMGRDLVSKPDGVGRSEPATRGAQKPGHPL